MTPVQELLAQIRANAVEAEGFDHHAVARR
jgi:hypothetical protein